MSGRDRLHRLVWLNQIDELKEHLETEEGKQEIDKLDVRGNAALHLAVMLHRPEAARILLEKGASLLTKNDLGWYPIHEARSVGQRDMIQLLLKYRKIQTEDYIKQRTASIISQLQELDDFYMEMRWDFSSWIPLVSRFCPSDTYKIWKKGAFVRVDTTLIGFENVRWVRGNISFIFRPDDNGGSLYMVDHQRKVFEKLDTIEDDNKLEDRINWMLNTNIRSGELLAEKMTFVRNKSGMFGLMGSGKSEKVGEFEADVYSLQGVKLINYTRTEHTAKELAQEAKDASEPDFSVSQLLDDAEAAAEKEEERQKILQQLDAKKDADLDKFYQNAKSKVLRYRPSLSLPPAPTVSFETYFYPELGQQQMNPTTKRFPHIHVGRPIQLNTHKRDLKATLWMSTTFPMFIEQLLPLLEIMAPSNEHFARLKEFVELKLPRGFPVKLEIPLFGVLTAKVTFQNYRHDSNISSDLFQIDSSYEKGEVKFLTD